MIGYFRTVLKAVACGESHFHSSWHLEYPSVVLFPQQSAIKPYLFNSPFEKSV